MNKYLIDLLLKWFKTIIKYLLLVYCIITLLAILFIGFLNAFNLINVETGSVNLPIRNVTDSVPTAEIGKYPYFKDAEMLVYFYTYGERTETLPADTICWGHRVNDWDFAIVSFSDSSRVRIQNGACTFLPGEEVIPEIYKFYPNINWVKVINGQIVP